MKIARFTMAGAVCGMGIPKPIFMAMLQALPDDVKVCGFGRDDMHNSSFIFLQSERFADIPEGHPVPEIDILCKVEERTTERTVISVSMGSAFLEALEVKVETTKDQEVRNSNL